MAFSWHCPYCNHNATINDEQYSVAKHDFHSNNKHDKRLRLFTHSIVCPNPECREYSITAELGIADPYSGHSIQKSLNSWTLKPHSTAKPLPDYIPQAIVSDYEEACLIKDLSPKSSATLARRCLQGILRDFWQVKPARLVDEIKSVKDKVDPITWQAIDGVRGIGNIGAHMEKDINVIVDVEPEEAQLLIGLLEHLIKEWYINRHEREKQMQALIGVASQKQEDKKKVAE
ncbi:hypothetical protein AOR11_04665 [Vibrio alginolyticus]|uniref:DUF4145 domain-containing protein n=1 Tax=Vibrio harveyi group TaxID=717610 RepID=UPI0006CA7161|nr:MULTISPECIES: DUF4145 domain-containing protein [Vibrio harveyi group]EGR9012123.1 DUF4145 domain-containing protein [Vibrio parahaemolyticus]KPN03677.1 hypothetical protein AOR11_04665 [Vibrio alginolyticus]TOA13638.1 DUF4145 domain-containing protein [Vibrio parahaemolyticus]